MVPTISNELRVSRNRATPRRNVPSPRPGLCPLSRSAYLAGAPWNGGLRPPRIAASARYAEEIQPILEQYCYGCHGLGRRREEWRSTSSPMEAAVKTPSSGTRCSRTSEPGSCRRPASRSRRPRIAGCWRTGSSTGRFGIDPTDPDPGRVTVRRLNRVEYRNTIRDLIGVDYDTTAEFPPDDTGHGFDNIGDVLTLSPLLLEKYLRAADAIIARAVPTVPKVVAERVVPGASFRRAGG